MKTEAKTTEGLTVYSHQVEAFQQGSVEPIADQDEYVDASTTLISVRSLRKQLEAKFEELQRPFKEGLKRLKQEFHLVEEKVVATEATIERRILAYRQRERVKAEEVNAEALAHYERDGSQPLPLLASADAGKVRSEEGTMGSRMLKHWHLDHNPTVGAESRQKVCRDEPCTAGIADHFFILDYTAVNSAVRANVPIEGITQYEKEILEVRR